MKKRPIIDRFCRLTFLLVFVSMGLGFEWPFQEKKKTEMPAKYKKWLEDEVLYIISDNEREVFENLRTDQEREDFIQAFWRRRDPTPGTPFNEFREEHYRRLEYADKHFFEGKPGRKTDRGRVYIMFGPPDFFETNPGGGRGFLFNPSGPTAEFPSEVWTYRHIPGLKERIGRVDFIFVNYYNAGAYQLTTNPALANALRNVSMPARDVGYEATKGEAYPGEKEKDLAVNPLEQLRLLAELSKSRGEVLEEMERSERLRKIKGFIEAKESLTALPFVPQVSFFQGREDLTSIPICIEVAGRDVAFKEADDRYRGTVSFYIEVRDPNQVVYQASDRLEMNLREETYRRRLSDSYIYKHQLELRPGQYFFHLVVWDEISGNVGYQDREITVPAFVSGQFRLSDVLFARSIEIIEPQKEQVVIKSEEIAALKSLDRTKLKVPDEIQIKVRPAEPFTFGNLKIEPNPAAVYAPNEELIFFYQIYNPLFDSVERKGRIRIEHQIWKGNSIVAVIDKPQEVELPLAQQWTGLNSGARYSLNNFEPGQYTLVIQVRDLLSNRVHEKRVDFRVR